MEKERHNAGMRGDPLYYQVIHAVKPIPGGGEERHNAGMRGD